MTLAAVVLLFFMQKNKRNDLLVFFIFILLLSDNWNYAFATIIKPFFIIAILVFLLLKKNGLTYTFIKRFVPFFIIALICLPHSYSFLTASQKTLSYALLLIIVPSFFLPSTHRNERTRFDMLRLLVFFNVMIITLGIVFNLIGLGIASVRDGRSGGLFGNPNGLGIFSFLTVAFMTIAYYRYPALFSKRWKIFSYGIIAIALFFSASRGGIFSSCAFLLVFLAIVKKKYGLVFIVVLIGLSAFLLLPAVDSSPSYQERIRSYLRLDKEDATSGREVGWNLTIREINNGNYWFSKGMGYSEYYMHQIAEEASQEGHQGNSHNSYLAIWLDVGLVGLIFFIMGWLACFWQLKKQWPVALAVFCGVLISSNVESWLAASLNPFTVYLLIILTFLSIHSNKKFV